MSKFLSKVVLLILTIFLLAACKGKSSKSLLGMSNEERVKYLKSLTQLDFDNTLKKLKPEMKEKIGFQMIKEGKRYFNMANYKKAYYLLHYANYFLPFKAENNYIMARVCSKLRFIKQAIAYLKKASSADPAYSRKSVDEPDFVNIKDSAEWRSFVYQVSEATLAGKWKGSREGIILKLFPNKTWTQWIVKNSVIEDTKNGSWKLDKITLNNGEVQYRVTLWGGMSGVYIVKVEAIEGFTLYDINKWHQGQRYFPAFKKKNFSGEQRRFSINSNRR